MMRDFQPTLPPRHAREMAEAKSLVAKGLSRPAQARQGHVGLSANILSVPSVGGPPNSHFPQTSFRAILRPEGKDPEPKNGAVLWTSSRQPACAQGSSRCRPVAATIWNAAHPARLSVRSRPKFWAKTQPLARPLAQPLASCATTLASLAANKTSRAVRGLTQQSPHSRAGQRPRAVVFV